MREIKFRAWDKNYNTMLEVLELDFEHIALRSRPIQQLPKSKLSDVILMQYTGLKDKNGKEIYEGDVISQSDGCNYEVRWHDEIENHYCGYDLCNRDGDEEVIGNVYESPELLKIKNQT